MGLCLKDPASWYMGPVLVVCGWQRQRLPQGIFELRMFKLQNLHNVAWANSSGYEAVHAREKGDGGR